MTYEEIRQRLTPGARALFIEMVEVHLAATKHREFALTGTLAGYTLDFWGDREWSLRDPDRGALNDLVGYSIVRLSGYGSHRDPRYEIPGEGVLFYQYLMAKSGQPIEQVEEAAMRQVDSQGFVKRHANASEHISKALELQRSDNLSVRVVTEIGTHLRAAVFDVAADISGDTKNRENPIPALKKKLESLDLQRRESAVLSQLVELVRLLLQEAQRLHHVRDEEDKGEPFPQSEEVRRAVHTTVFALAELDRAFE